jgi:pyrimidine-nucleoside phosphorylase
LVPYDIICRKRDGGILLDDEIGEFVSGFTHSTIPDYQMAALAMAIFLRGMNRAETESLTRHMLASGPALNWTTGTQKVDKHSTGGIGDKISLVLAPLLACCEVQVPMLSGRGLGPTGGTLDKLESIPGFRTDLSLAEIQSQVETVGCVITGTTPELVPADRKLYALRDVTGTVESIPLITASIMSKKLAESLDALVLDVKVGSGAFMKTLESARQLAQSLVDVGNRMGVRTTALISDMNQPLGRMIGNAVEVDEAIDLLTGRGPADARQLTFALGDQLLRSIGVSDSPRDRFERAIESGAAMERFERMIAVQGGNLAAKRPRAANHTIVASRPGYVRSIDGRQLGLSIVEMGGGRKVASDRIDYSVGIEMFVRLGDQVERSEPLVQVFAPAGAIERVRPLIERAIEVGDDPISPGPLIPDILVKNDGT